MTALPPVLVEADRRRGGEERHEEHDRVGRVGVEDPEHGDPDEDREPGDHAGAATEEQRQRPDRDEGDRDPAVRVVEVDLVVALPPRDVPDELGDAREERGDDEQVAPVTAQKRAGLAHAATRSSGNRADTRKPPSGPGPASSRPP